MENRAFLAREFSEWSITVPKDPGICESGHTWLILDKPGLINVYGAVTCYCRQYKIRPLECPDLLKSQGYTYMKSKSISWACVGGYDPAAKVTFNYTRISEAWKN